ncbi:MAG: hypothetical protein Q8M77_15850 [Hydrogenophaga sp.]|nr:hypothetical protein [Hydrogenophaga sp.]
MLKYAGEYVATCEALGDSINLDQGGMVYGRLISKVQPISDSSASYTFRIDFFADAQCAAIPLGSLANDNPLSTVSIVGTTTIGGIPVDKVRFSIQQTADAFQPGGTPDVVVVGTAIRLALPAALARGFSLDDLWRLEADVLYEGDLSVGPDGFPTDLDRTSPVQRVTSAPAAAFAACAPATVGWMGMGGQCAAQILLATSGNVLGVEDQQGVVVGNASFTCSNGTWVERPGSVCRDTLPPPVPKCPAQTWNWTENGETCSGTSRAVVQDGFDYVWNETAGKTGGKGLFCRLNESGVLAWSEIHTNGITYEDCALPPVPPPPATEPMEILQRANCLACHSVSGSSLVGPSFATIADFYRSNPPDSGVLEQRIRQGGAGVFGPVPMPANPQISDEQIHIIVPWILAR